MKNCIFIGLILTTISSGYANGSSTTPEPTPTAPPDVCSASFGGGFKPIEGGISSADEDEIKKAIEDAVRKMDPNIKLSIHIETKIFRDPESGTGTPGPITSNEQTAKTISEGTSTQATPTTEDESTTTEKSTAAAITPKTLASTKKSTTDIQTTQMETSTAATTTPEMTSLSTTEKTTADTPTTQMVTTQLVRHSGPVYENCSNDRTAPYFWISKKHDKRDVTFEQGRQICGNCSSVPAVIPDQNTSKEITTTIRRIYEGDSPIYWTGITIDPEAGTLSPSYSYWEGTGAKSISIDDTKVALTAYSFGAVMVNTAPDLAKHGIVCWKPKS